MLWGMWCVLPPCHNSLHAQHLLPAHRTPSPSTHVLGTRMCSIHACARGLHGVHMIRKCVRHNTLYVWMRLLSHSANAPRDLPWATYLIDRQLPILRCLTRYRKLRGSLRVSQATRVSPRVGPCSSLTCEGKRLHENEGGVRTRRLPPWPGARCERQPAPGRARTAASPLPGHCAAAASMPAQTHKMPCASTEAWANATIKACIKIGG